MNEYSDFCVIAVQGVGFPDYQERYTSREAADACFKEWIGCSEYRVIYGYSKRSKSWEQLHRAMAAPVAQSVTDAT